MKRLLILSTIILLSTCSCLHAQQERLPDYTGYVNDFAGVLSPASKARLNDLITQLQQKTTAQIALVTVNSVRPLAIEQYAVELFEKWGIGQKGKDNGVLILMAAADREIRIETGYGLEGALPDAVCSQIIHQLMIPAFKAGELEKGLILGTLAVADAVAKEYSVELDLQQYGDSFVPAGAPRSARSRALNIIFSILFFTLIFGLRSGLLFFLLLSPRGRRRGGYWYGTGFGGRGGSFGGGFGGFGGGFSGGGGAGGSW